MPFIGKTPTRVPLTSADIQDSTINSAKITDDAIVNADVNSSAAIAYSKLNLTGNIALADLSATGTKDATTFLRGDNSFAEAGGGSLTFLGSTTVTTTDVSAISFDGLFTSAYTHYKFIYSIRGATNNTDTIVRIRQSNSDVTASNYWYAGMGMYRASGSTTANTAGANGAGYILISSTDNTDNVAYPTTGELILFNPLSTTVNKTITTTNLGYNSATTPSAIRIWTFGAQLVDTTAASGLSFLYDGGNIVGTVSLYGIKNS
jgi:hypothetical protein